LTLFTVTHIWKNVTGERTVGGIGDETIHPIGEVLIGTLEGIREVPALVALMALGVLFDVPGGRAKDVFILLHGGFIATVTVVGAAAGGAGVTSGEVHRVRNGAIGMRLTFRETGHLRSIFKTHIYITC